MVSTWSFLFHSFFLSIYYVHIHAWIHIYICIHITYIYIWITHIYVYIYMYTYLFTFEVLIGYLLTSSRALHTFPALLCWGIEKAGGRVVFDGYANHRVYAKNARYPGLNMSRCIGTVGGCFGGWAVPWKMLDLALPSGYVKIAIENGHRVDFPIKHGDFP